MHPNYEFLLDYAHRHAAAGRVLDYGCGSGDVVVEGRRRGLDIEGAEIFYGGGDTRAQVAETGLLGSRIHEIVDGRVPVEDGRYDLVMSNQVLEHVEDLESVVAEISRVLRPGGRVLSLFPSRDVWREGHTGIPFLHRLPADARLTRRYVVAARRLGLGYHTAGKTAGQWAEDLIEWVDRYCHYLPRDVIDRCFRRHFDIEPLEHEHAAFRVQLRFGHRAARVVGHPLARPLTRFSERKLAHLTFVGVKR